MEIEMETEMDIEMETQTDMETETEMEMEMEFSLLTSPSFCSYNLILFCWLKCERTWSQLPRPRGRLEVFSRALTTLVSGERRLQDGR